MPNLETQTYNPPLFFKQKHLNTIYPALFRRVKIKYQRERLELSDGDFIDLDWSAVGRKKMVLMLHGLEGSSESNYIKGMIRVFNQNGYDGAVMNFRGCSGEPNRLLRTYHSGETEDVETVLQIILSKKKYQEIILVGFSLGGNVALKYIGERGNKIDNRIKYGIGISVPCDLAASGREIKKPHNSIYLNRFLSSLKAKAKTKQAFADQIDLNKIMQSKDFDDFDNAFTAPVHGFKDAEDYWAKCSSKQFLNQITIPTLLINAKDDSFLSDTSYPYEEADTNRNFHFIAPKYGGHCGFTQFNSEGVYWSEEQAIDFVKSF